MDFEKPSELLSAINNNPIHILLIDDEPTLLDLGIIFLKEQGGFEVTSASKVSYALSLLDTQIFDAIVSDYQMPEMDGLSLLTLLREQGNDTPFIIFTGKGREEVAMQALNCGADFYIQKAGDPKSEFADLESKIRYAVYRKRAEKELESTLDNLKRSQQIAHIGNWMLNVNKGVFTASEEGLAIFGFLENNQPSMDDISAAIHPDDRVFARNTLAKTLETGDPYNIDIRIHRCDTGELRYIQSQGFLLNKDSDEKIVFGTNLDITDRKKAEIALSETNSFLENLIRIASVPILIWNQEYLISRLNSACEQLLGLPADVLIDKSLCMIFPPDKVALSMQKIESLIHVPGGGTIELDIMHSDGSIRIVEWNVATLFDRDFKNPVATIAQGQDITDKIRIERERDIAEVQIQQNLTQLAILNDGIRNPLTAISGYVELYGDEKLTEKIHYQVRIIDEMVTQGDRRWAESEKILNFLRKHSEVRTVSDSDDSQNPMKP
jgi:PAS domain S-box-containing protein